MKAYRIIEIGQPPGDPDTVFSIMESEDGGPETQLTIRFLDRAVAEKWIAGREAYNERLAIEAFNADQAKLTRH